MIPVSPASNWIAVFACCRKFWRRSAWRRTLLLLRRGGGELLLARLALDALEVGDAERDERLAIHVGVEQPALQPVAHDLAQRGAASRRGRADDADDLRTAQLELEVHRASLEFAHRLVVQ